MVLEADWESGTALEGLVTVTARPAKILVTGNLGYVGPSVVARLRESYPDASLIGLDAGFFAHCLTGCSAMPERSLDYQYFGDVRAVSPSVLEGDRRRRASRGDLERPDR